MEVLDDALVVPRGEGNGNFVAVRLRRRAFDMG